MSYVPNIPGVPSPMSYGQGYGNWQQYAGFNKNNPFGGEGGIADNAKTPVAPPVVQPVPAAPATPDSTMDYSIAPESGTMGAKPNNQLGLKNPTPYSSQPMTTQQIIESHYGGE